VPGARLQARQLELRRALQKKKRLAKKTTGKKLVRRKKKRVRKTRPARERFRDAIIEDTRPSAYADTAFPPGPTTGGSTFFDEKTGRWFLWNHDAGQWQPYVPSGRPSMPVEAAEQRIGNAMRDFVMARPRWERLETGRVYHDLKTSFKKAYGERRWKETYAWCVDEWGLEDYIFDYEALRDS